MEVVFSAVEPFLEPLRSPEVRWPTDGLTALFWSVLTGRIEVLNSADPAATQRHFCLNLIAMISCEKMPNEAFENVKSALSRVTFSDLIPTSEMVDLLDDLLEISESNTAILATLIILEADWSMLFSIKNDESAITTLLNMLLFCISESFPIAYLDQLREKLLDWRNYPWHMISNESLRRILIDLPPAIAVDSFVHPTSCHKPLLELIRTVSLNGEENTTQQDIERRRF